MDQPAEVDPLTVAFFKARFEAAGDPSRAAGERAYLKSTLDFHGVSIPEIRAACRDFCRAHPDLTRAQLKALADALYRTSFHDLRSAGIGVLELRADVLRPADAGWLIGLVRRSANWAHVDWLACKVIGGLVTRHPALLSRLPAWAADPDFWVRRTSLLAQVDELRAGRGDFQLFARLAEPMLPEKEFFIRKALGWVLRETSKKRPELTFQFLRAHRTQASGLTFREGSKHLPAAMRRALG